MIDYNGTATCEVPAGGGSVKTLVVAARITPLRVQTATRTWDKTGKRVSAHRAGMSSRRLLGYKLHGKPYVEIAPITDAVTTT